MQLATSSYSVMRRTRSPTNHGIPVVTLGSRLVVPLPHHQLGHLILIWQSVKFTHGLYRLSMVQSQVHVPSHRPLELVIHPSQMLETTFIRWKFKRAQMFLHWVIFLYGTRTSMKVTSMQAMAHRVPYTLVQAVNQLQPTAVMQCIKSTWVKCHWIRCQSTRIQHNCRFMQTKLANSVWPIISI